MANTYIGIQLQYAFYCAVLVVLAVIFGVAVYLDSSSPMTREEIEAAVKKCKDSGMDALSYSHPDLPVYTVTCVKRDR